MSDTMKAAWIGGVFVLLGAVIAGDGVAALKAYEESLAIRRRLAELDPNKVEWQTDLRVGFRLWKERLISKSPMPGLSEQVMAGEEMLITQYG